VTDGYFSILRRYRELLDRWQLWHLRAEFDVSRNQVRLECALEVPLACPTMVVLTKWLKGTALRGLVFAANLNAVLAPSVYYRAEQIMRRFSFKDSTHTRAILQRIGGMTVQPQLLVRFVGLCDQLPLTPESHGRFRWLWHSMSVPTALYRSCRVVLDYATRVRM
jgi:hypothetical protein